MAIIVSAWKKTRAALRLLGHLAKQKEIAVAHNAKVQREVVSFRQPGALRSLGGGEGF